MFEIFARSEDFRRAVGGRADPVVALAYGCGSAALCPSVFIRGPSY